MIYNDSDFTKRGVEASILSIKNDLNRRIGHVQLKYGEIYDAIIAESNGLVDFVNEFRAAVNTIVNECNDLQGLTDDELTEIKQRIEELKEILDSIDIPDLPKIKKPEDVFSENSTNEKPDNKFTYVPIDSPNPMPGSSNPDSTAFFCGGYSITINDSGFGDPVCEANYVVWNNDMQSGACVIGYDEETYEAGRTDGFTGCMSKYEADDMNCYSGFATRINDIETASGEQACFSGFSAQNGTICEAYYEQDTTYRACTVNFSNAAGENCVEEYYFDGTNVNCDEFSGYGADCPGSYVNSTGLELCSHDYKDDDITCKTYYGTAPGSQTITDCTGGFGTDGINCPSNWSYGLGKNACRLNYSDGSITCAKGYITDGVRKWCDNHDAACGRCLLGYCAPANYTPCDYCPSYSPPCSYTPECSEGEPEPCHQEPTCQPCVDIADTCGGDYACSVNCNLAHDDCTGVCNVVRHGSDD